MNAQKIMQEKDIRRVSAAQAFSSVFAKILVYAFLIVMALIVLFPFYWMLISSVKSISEYRLSVPTLFPREILWRNYLEAFTQANLGKLFLNTMYVGLVSTLLSLVITVLSAFAFARLEFKGKDTLFAALLGTMTFHRYFQSEVPSTLAARYSSLGICRKFWRSR